MNKPPKLPAEIPSVRVQAELKEKIKLEAIRQNRTISQLVRIILAAEVKNDFRSVR